MTYVFLPGALAGADPAAPEGRGWAERASRLVRLYRGARLEVWRAGAWWYSVNGQRCPKGLRTRDEAIARALAAVKRRAGRRRK